MKQKYKTLVDRFKYPAGTVVEHFEGHDFGLARDDTLALGEFHVSVSVNGKTPFFTIAAADLEEVEHAEATQ